MPQEIEKKYLVLISEVPSLIGFEPTFTEQGYLPDGTRLRRQGTDHFMTKKEGHQMVRTEEETVIDKDLFDQLWPDTENARLEKDRYSIPFGKFLIELDFFRGPLKGLIIAEVEFTSSEEADRFNPPSWFGLEVSNDARYYNDSFAGGNLPRGENGSLELEIGFNFIVNIVNAKSPDPDNPIIIAVAGGSASGKTNLAKRLYNYFGRKRSLFLSMDDYYLGRDYCEQNKILLDDPRAVNLVDCHRDLLMLKKGESIDRPIYSFEAGKRTGSVKVESRPIIIVEGLFALLPMFKTVSDIKVFVDANIHDRFVRRLIRDLSRTLQSPAEIAEAFLISAQPLHKKYVETTISSADLIISNKRRALVEDERIEKRQKQNKFFIGGHISPREINQIIHDIEAGWIDWANKPNLSEAVIHHKNQLDYYYRPIGSQESSEVIRVRNAQATGTDNDKIGNFSLSYKGSVSDGKRPIYEIYPLDSVLVEAFDKSDYQKILTISKSRFEASYPDINVRIDYVTFDHEACSDSLGHYLEICEYTNDQQVIVEKLLDRFRLTADQAIDKSYFEIAMERLGKK